jgi:ribosomal protein S18 acetylase RimI-like enzyme
MEIIRTTDAERISRLNREIQELHHRLYPNTFKPYDFPAVSRFFEKVVVNPNFLFFIATNGEEDAAYLWVEIREHPENAFMHARTSVYIHHLNVVERYRNQGIGKRLLEKVCDIARTRAIGKVELDYWIGNREAQNFYEKQGFQAYRSHMDKEIT